jgi:DNA-binding MarR family transcriptional regulator
MTETEIAEELKVDQSTVSRDIKVLKELLQTMPSCYSI